MKREYTLNELNTNVGQFYKGFLNTKKALQLFELEYGFIPTIVERENIITQKFCDTQGYPEYINPKALTYMKDLQDSGVVNMVASSEYIQSALLLDRKEARELLLTYMKDYNKIYFPENTL